MLVRSRLGADLQDWQQVPDGSRPRSRSIWQVQLGATRTWMRLCCADRPEQDTRDLDPENDGDIVERDRQRGLLAATWSVLHRPRRRSDARHLRRSARCCAAAVLCGPGSVGHCLAQACKWCLGVAARKLPDAKANLPSRASVAPLWMEGAFPGGPSAYTPTMKAPGPLQAQLSLTGR